MSIEFEDKILSDLSILLDFFDEYLITGVDPKFEAFDIYKLFKHFYDINLVDKARVAVSLFEDNYPNDALLPLCQVRLAIASGEQQKACELLINIKHNDDWYWQSEYLECLYIANQMELLEIQAYKFADSDVADEKALMLNGAKYATLQQYHIATIFYDAYLRRIAENEAVLEDILNCLIKQGKYEEAKPYSERLVALNPYCYETWFNKSTIDWNCGDRKTALEDLEYAIAINPVMLEAHNRKVAILIGSNSFDQALDYLVEMENQVPDSEDSCNIFRGDICFLKKDYKTAIRYYKKSYPRGVTFIESRMRYFHSCYKAHNFIKAKEVGEDLLFYLPNSVNVLLDMIDVYSNLGYNTEADKMLKRAFKYHPNNVMVLVEMALRKMDNENFKGAYRYINKALKIEPERFEPNFWMAVVCQMLNKKKDVVSYYLKAHQLQPELCEYLIEDFPEVTACVEEQLKKNRKEDK